MTTTVKAKSSKTAKPAGRSIAKITHKPAAKAKKALKKPLRIRSELLPESARYITIDDVEYVALPVVEFGDWYEDTLDGAVADYVESLGEPAIPAEKVLADLGIKPTGK